MAEKVVSVKMPSTLVGELKLLQEQDHYLDLSEQLRSVVRRRCLELTNPFSEGIKEIRQEVQRQAEQTTAKKTKEQVLQELLKVLGDDA